MRKDQPLVWDTWICIDNSERTRISDYVPNRFTVQINFAKFVCRAKFESKMENRVGIMTMAGEDAQVLIAPTRDLKEISKCLNGMQIGGIMNLPSGVQKATSALKHSQNREHPILVLVGSPIKQYKETLVFIGRELKRENIAINVVSFCKDLEDEEKLEALVATANKDGNSHFVHISPCFTDSGAALGRGHDHPEFHYNAAPDINPVVPLVLRVAEGRATKEQATVATQEDGGEGSSSHDVTGGRSRYLYLSDGIVVSCLELKQSTDPLQILPLPKIATVKLLENGGRISRSLFKLGRDVYLCGGQVITRNSKEESQRSQRWGTSLYKKLMRDNLSEVDDISRSFSKLTLDGNVLTLSDCDIGEMKMPKVLTAIEKINGLVHLFGPVFPFELEGCHYSMSRFSHEVLVNKDWIQIPTELIYNHLYSGDIRRYLVVGNHMYTFGYEDLHVFDSNTLRWGWRYSWSGRNPFRIQHVYEILSYGNARCAGEHFPGYFTEPLFVVIAMIEKKEEGALHPSVIAYLVSSSTGRVICYQRIHEFFEGLPICVSEPNKLISVDEEGNSMCSIVCAKAVEPAEGGEILDDLLFINVFTLEGLADAVDKVREMMRSFTPVGGKGTEHGGIGKAITPSYAVELDFVRFVVEHKHIFKTDSELRHMGDLTTFKFLRACFR